MTNKKDLWFTENGSPHEYEEINYDIIQIIFFKILVNPEEEEVIVTKFLMRESMNTVLEQQDLNIIMSPTPLETVNLSNINEFN